MTARPRRLSARNRSALRLLTLCGVLAVIWGVLLPRLAGVTSIAAHVELLERRRIDASAMFYTELPREHLLGTRAHEAERAGRGMQAPLLPEYLPKSADPDGAKD